VLLYRVASIRYKNSTLSGIGAEKVGGRWNLPGTRAVYCSENVSLALLEYYVNSKNASILPSHILVAKISIPDDFEINELAELPEEWNNSPYTNMSAKIFSELAKSRDFFALKVPSAVVPIEYNYVLNPLFKDFSKVEIVEFVTLNLDERLS